MVIGTQTISWKKKFSSYALITVGTFLMAAGTNLVYEPLSMVTGGFAGIGIILRQFVPLPLWLVTAVLNVPLFLVAARKFGMVFVRKTLYATASFSLALALIPSLPIIHGDYLMAALLGGALNWSLAEVPPQGVRICSAPFCSFCFRPRARRQSSPLWMAPLWCPVCWYSAYGQGFTQLWRCLSRRV